MTLIITSEVDNTGAQRKLKSLSSGTHPATCLYEKPRRADYKYIYYDVLMCLLAPLVVKNEKKILFCFSSIVG